MPRVSDAVAVAARAVAPAAWRVSLAAWRVSLAAVARVRRAVAGDVADVVRRPAARDDLVAEALALLVLAQLEVEAEQALDHAQEPRPLTAAAVQPGAQLGERVDEAVAPPVHDVLG